MLNEHEQYDSEEETLEDLYDGDDDADAEVEAELDDALAAMTPGEGADDATEDGDDDSPSDDSDSDEEDDEEDEPLLDLGLTEEGDGQEPLETQETQEPPPAPSSDMGSSMDVRSPSAAPMPAPEPAQKRPLSPAQLRRNALAFSLDRVPRTYTVEAISAIPHPVPTHALASSACMTHLLTGSDDGYLRDYDIFAAVNSKNFLTAPQRSHAGVVEGLMKSGQLRYWWSNPALPDPRPLGMPPVAEEEPTLAPIYSLTMQSDALWALAGTDGGYINLFTVRHDPGRLIHVMNGHRGPISALSLDYDEKGFFSAGWDGEAIQWDLNTGQPVRHYTAHNAQLSGVAVRPLASGYALTGPAVYNQPGTQGTSTGPSQHKSEQMDVDINMFPTDTKESNLASNDKSMAVDNTDARSDASFDPLFDDVPDEPAQAPETKLAMPSTSLSHLPSRIPPSAIPPPKGAPPLFNPAEYATYSPDLLMTTFIDGQVILWDRRVQTSGKGVGRLWMSEKTPPWCLSACWSADGAQIYAGRRNGTVDVWDVRVLGQSGPANTPRMFKTLRNPTSSGVVSCVVAFPDCRHMACASVDNIRLWNVNDAGEDSSGRPKSGVQFKIIPGHHGGYISQMLIDAGARFLVSASSNRGWHGDSTRTVFVHDIKRVD